LSVFGVPYRVHASGIGCVLSFCTVFTTPLSLLPASRSARMLDKTADGGIELEPEVSR
jgi:hypothetical protein